MTKNNLKLTKNRDEKLTTQIFFQVYRLKLCHHESFKPECGTALRQPLALPHTGLARPTISKNLVLKLGTKAIAKCPAQSSLPSMMMGPVSVIPMSHPIE